MQQPLFHEDINEALMYVVSGLGEPKEVFHDLWPTLSPPDAGRKVKHCLSSNHNQKLDLAEMIWILKKAKQKGLHSAMAYICSEAGYAPPMPIEPEDEIAELQKQFISATDQLAKLAELIKRSESKLEHPGNLK